MTHDLDTKRDVPFSGSDFNGIKELFNMNIVQFTKNLGHQSKLMLLPVSDFLILRAAALFVVTGLALAIPLPATAQYHLQNTHEYFHLNQVEVEAGETAIFTVRVPEKLTFAVRWRYHTEDGSATAGTDYTAISGTVTFAIGEREKTLSVPTQLGDPLGSDLKIFQLHLTDLEVAHEGEEWTRPGYLPRLPETTAAHGIILPGGLLDVLVPEDEDTVPVGTATGGVEFLPLNPVDPYGNDEKDNN